MSTSKDARGALPWWQTDTLMTRVDKLATSFPDRVYAAYPKSPLTYDAGFRDYTYHDLASAVNGLAWLLRNALGHGTVPETLAYIGPNDIRYPALILGAAKVGHKVSCT